MDRSYVGTCACVLALAAISCAGNSASTAPEDVTAKTDALLRRTPKVPAELVVPEGQHLAFRLAACGVQVYTCQAPAAAADGTVGPNAWVFTEPEAELYGLFGRRAGHHYAGPTWEATDGSSVVGKRLAGATVETTAIPWLLLEASGHTGHGLMSRVSYVQRLDTRAGLAPTGSCELGAKSEVDYTATYAFYVPNARH